MCRGDILLRLHHNPDSAEVKCTLMEARNVVPNISNPGVIYKKNIIQYICILVSRGSIRLI